MATPSAMPLITYTKQDEGAAIYATLAAAAIIGYIVYIISLLYVMRTSRGYSTYVT